MLEWIAKYWLEVLFTLICSGAAFAIRHHVKLIIDSKKDHEQNTLKQIDEKFKEQGIAMQEKMDQCYNRLLDVVKESENKSNAEDEHIHKEINTIMAGVLAVEGRAFKNECRRLLQEDHTITLDEYQNTVSEHGVYNGLGGNHEGDLLFSAVKAKYERSLNIINGGD